MPTNINLKPIQPPKIEIVKLPPYSFVFTPTPYNTMQNGEALLSAIVLNFPTESGTYSPNDSGDFGGISVKFWYGFSALNISLASLLTEGAAFLELVPSITWGPSGVTFGQVSTPPPIPNTNSYGALSFSVPNPKIAGTLVNNLGCTFQGRPYTNGLGNCEVNILAMQKQGGTFMYFQSYGTWVLSNSTIIAEYPQPGIH